jgi:hypothetical protein
MQGDLHAAVMIARDLRPAHGIARASDLFVDPAPKREGDA